MTKEIIKSTLESAYSRDNWIALIRHTFTNGQFNAKPVEIGIQKNEIAEHAYEIGSFETADERLIGIYEIKIKAGENIERKRVGLRQLLRSIYKQVDGAFVVFNQGEKWRFSYVSEVNTRDADGKLVKSQTEPKRYTYVFGKNIANRTAIERFTKLLGKSVELEDIKEAFSVDALTKEFYRELSDWYFWALQNVKFPDDEEKNKDVRNATSTIRLITRIMFVWFLKQKGLIPEELFDKGELERILKYNDKTGSTYYKAILQNLFFATLNTEMGDSNRKFVDRQYGVQGYYRYKRFFKDVDRFMELTKNIPFLNGGLFENLDKVVANEEPIRIDCFSNRLDNETRLVVPDFLFFGDATVDLSVVYDDKKRRSVEVHGLINILKKYNFTIEENTPLDVEVALDPELLGKVFENLLASYNPETQSTARKQTGSFYTPREIVDYMVDESLKAYLLLKLSEQVTGYIPVGQEQTEMFGNEVKKGQLGLEHAIEKGWDEKERYEKLLNELLSYTTDEHGFTQKEVESLISAIDNCKILDPACGSGAFPMGVLHKMVHVLHKLDPNNKLWKEKQIHRVRNAREAISQIQELTARENALRELEKNEIDIEKAFANNELDYGRKLYLIENCIYGVDIQAIAVQIAKLRFFISLVVDQKIHVNENNLGIRPLPNLETKFVAANTLNVLEREYINLFTNPEIDKKKSELKRVRLDHFEAKTPGRKNTLRKRDEQLRSEIAQLLMEEHELQPKAAKLLANWNPYDQNSSATFFDPEWMFGIRSGFHLVLGNPPYGAKFTADEKAQYRKQYPETQFKIDSYSLFILRTLSLLSPNGLFYYIIPNTLLDNYFEEKVREKLLNKNRIVELLDLHDSVFSDAVVHSMILGVQRTEQSNYFIKSKMHGALDSIPVAIPNTYFKSQDKSVFAIRSYKYAHLIEKLNLNSIALENVVDIKDGIDTGDNKKYVSDKPLNKNWKPLIGGKDIERFYLHCDKYILHGDHLANPRRPEVFEQSKIVVRETGDRIIATFDNEHHYALSTLYSFNLKDTRFDMKYLLGLLNSNVYHFLMNLIAFEKTKGAFTKTRIFHYYKLPVRIISKKEQDPVIKIVDRILNRKQNNPSFDSCELELELNTLIYQIFDLTATEINVIESVSPQLLAK